MVKYVLCTIHITYYIITNPGKTIQFISFLVIS